jgi:hypothetical protein
MVQILENAFSLRRLNPFNGTLQVFPMANARALSSNGLRWEIQILSDRPQGLWANIPFAGQQFYRFGIWTQSEGLRQVPLNPLFNTRSMLAAAEAIINRLLPALDELPFPLSDPYELWLLDAETGLPVALLDSARNREELATKDLRRWIAAEPGDFRFVSNHLSALGQPINDGHNPRVHASVLEALVRTRGGQNQRNGWFLRQPDGTGTPLETQNPELAPSCFPELPLTLDWEHREDQALILDYLEWKAPQLLLLPGISPATREKLERLAVKDAEQIERFWRLYPEIHNKRLLNTARVEARIRNSTKPQTYR